MRVQRRRGVRTRRVLDVDSVYDNTLRSTMVLTKKADATPFSKCLCAMADSDSRAPATTKLMSCDRDVIDEALFYLQHRTQT